VHVAFWHGDRMWELLWCVNVHSSAWRRDVVKIPQDHRGRCLTDMYSILVSMLYRAQALRMGIIPCRRTCCKTTNECSNVGTYLAPFMALSMFSSLQTWCAKHHARCSYAPTDGSQPQILTYGICIEAPVHACKSCVVFFFRAVVWLVVGQSSI
jgi:hypothetical protein